MMARTYRTEAVVLRSFRLGEADRVLHVYTADRGARETLALVTASYEHHGGFRLRTLAS